MRRASLLLLPLALVAACAEVAGGYARVEAVPDDVLRYLPAGAAAEDVRIREECLYAVTEDGIVPIVRGRVEVYCNPAPPLGSEAETPDAAAV